MLLLGKNRSLTRTTWCWSGTGAPEQVRFGQRCSGKAGGEALLTWALRGSQEGGCIGTRLNGAPAFPVYLQEGRADWFQTARPVGRSPSSASAYTAPSCPSFSLQLYCKVGTIILRKKYLYIIHTGPSIINAVGRFFIKLRHINHFY